MKEPAEDLAKKKVLVVDDAEAIRRLVCSTLAQYGFACVEAADGVEALEVINRLPLDVDLVLTDLVMPGVDGSKLIQGVKNMSPETPAILVSGTVKIYEHESSADLFLAKGMYMPADLLERIRVMLVRKRGPKRSHFRTQGPPQNPALSCSAASA